MSTSVTPGAKLFERLPDRIFAPLAAQNRQFYWRIFCKVYGRRFGPHAPLPPANGYPKGEIIDEFERELAFEDLAVDTPPETPLGIRAATTFDFFREAGWFRVDRIGVREMVSMRPVVGQFIDRLVDFADHGPVFLSGKVRSIETNLQLIMSGAASGDTLEEVATQARQLMEYVRNTGTTVRDIMEAVSQEQHVRGYVARFFADFISQVFIADYGELRTRDHPLARRPQILRMVEELRASHDQSERLTAWYLANRAKGDAERALWMLERDLARIDDIRRIDEYLDRLDDEINRANRRAIAYLDYRLRSLRPMDELIKSAVQNVIRRPGAAAAAPFGAGILLGPAVMAQPRAAAAKMDPAPLRQATVSIEQSAKMLLRERAREARQITPEKMATYLEAQMRGHDRADPMQFAVETVTDFRALQTLLSAASANASKNRNLIAASLRMTPGRLVRYVGTKEVAGAYISSMPVEVVPRSTAKDRS